MYVLHTVAEPGYRPRVFLKLKFMAKSGCGLWAALVKIPTFFSVIRSRMLPPFISAAKEKHPTLCVLASYGAECSRHSFPTLKINIRHLFLASYGAECSRHSFPPLKRNTRHLYFSVDTEPSVGNEWREHTAPYDAKNKCPVFLYSVGNEWRKHSAPYDAKNQCRVFLFSVGNEWR